MFLGRLRQCEKRLYDSVIFRSRLLMRLRVQSANIATELCIQQVPFFSFSSFIYADCYQKNLQNGCYFDSPAYYLLRESMVCEFA